MCFLISGCPHIPSTPPIVSRTGTKAPHDWHESPLDAGSSEAESLSRTSAFWPSGLGPQQDRCPASGTAHHGPTRASRVDPHCWGSCGYDASREGWGHSHSRHYPLIWVRAMDEEAKGQMVQEDWCIGVEDKGHSLASHPYEAREAI